MNYNQPVETLSKNHFKAHHQIMDDYKSLIIYEEEMESYKDFLESQHYQKPKSQVIKILKRIIENKVFLGWNCEFEKEQLKTLEE